MVIKRSGAFTFVLCLGLATVAAFAVFAQPLVSPQAAPQVQFLTAAELKAKLTNNEPVTVLDVRSGGDFGGSENKIKGAIHVKARKLQSRLAHPPLKNVSHDSEVVTYCACPNDEAAIRAAQVLMSAGFKRVRALRGGWLAWKKTNGQVEAKPRGF
ncbi:MAG TPA: rhodanese-like domain-containing protein [Pyrinomonadaceae bacterium]|jgi:rhodanese-related sulfurtransferase|nr:rhodanese-like domain-containing protein [Pyrinomonadaceae bacterium]